MSRVQNNTLDPIKICDAQGNDIQYNGLNIDEKENVLGELLFQSALQNIAVQQIVIFYNNVFGRFFFIQITLAKRKFTKTFLRPKTLFQLLSCQIIFVCQRKASSLT